MSRVIRIQGIALVYTCGPVEPLRLGFMASLTGRGADLGVEGRNGASLAIEQINAQGGINGRSIELLVMDHGEFAENLPSQLAAFKDQGGELIIGPMTSAVAMKLVPLVNEHALVLVSPTVTTMELTGIDDNFFRVVSDTSNYAKLSARYSLDSHGPMKAVAIYDRDNRSYTETWVRSFQAVYMAGTGSFVGEITYSQGMTASFYNLVLDLHSKQPDLYVVCSNAVDAALICTQIRKLEPRATIILSEWSATQKFIELSGAAAEDTLIAQFVDHQSTSHEYSQFKSAYEQRFGQSPGFGSIAGYDAARLAITAYEQRRRQEDLKQTILRIGTFAGIQTPIHLDAFGDARRQNYLSIVRNGQFVTVK
jgi:branched-chain amino acid transport system substrate-binding protein